VNWGFFDLLIDNGHILAWKLLNEQWAIFGLGGVVVLCAIAPLFEGKRYFL